MIGTIAPGPIITEATVESLRDLWDAERGSRSADQVRRMTVADSQVDMEATLISLPPHWIRRLGLAPTETRHTLRGGGSARVYDPIRLTIRGRSCTVDVLEAPDGHAVVIGRLPLLNLDLVVDTANRALIGNPAHGGEQMYELY